MSAQGITVQAVAFPDPARSSITDNDFRALSSQFSYSYAENYKITALSVTDTLPGSDISGLLYSPSLQNAPNGSCPMVNDYVPTNAVRAPISSRNIGYIALAPWINRNCTLAYLSAVQGDPIRAFVFYLTANNTDAPPPVESVAWDLGDGGNWKTGNKFPVYAIPGATGAQVMQQVALYSGNVTSVPNGHTIAGLVPASDYVRLAMNIDLVGGPTLPSLWVFLLIVLGILIAIIATTSISMHIMQRHRRHRLRQRIARGEVDVEALGIRRLTVPDDVLNKMPVYNYGSTPAYLSAAASKDEFVADDKPVQRHKGDRTSAATTIGASSVAPSVRKSYSQPTCAICLDDFLVGESAVRELPCQHIFHPECIDAFLKENSSLCPMCKKSVLPKGYCPAQVTNAMVRRERMIRRLRESSPGDDEEGGRAATRGNRVGLTRLFRRRARPDQPVTVIPMTTDRSAANARRLPSPTVAASPELRSMHSVRSTTQTPAVVGTTSTLSIRSAPTSPTNASPPSPSSKEQSEIQIQSSEPTEPQTPPIPANPVPNHIQNQSAPEGPINTTSSPSHLNLPAIQTTPATDSLSRQTSRTEWARQRAIAMVGGEDAVINPAIAGNTVGGGGGGVGAVSNTPPEVEEEERRRAQRSGFRKVLGKIFPGSG